MNERKQLDYQNIQLGPTVTKQIVKTDFDNFSRDTVEFQLSKIKCRSSHVKSSQETHFAEHCTEKQIRQLHGNVLINNFHVNGIR